MDAKELDQRLSRISTLWTVLFRAHAAEPGEGASAQAVLIQRYSGAVYRYLLGALRDPDAAQELAQEFALRLLRGDFRRVNPERGRFRDYLKTVLRHLVTDHHRARLASPHQFASTSPDPVILSDSFAEERTFVDSWREELLARTWGTLREINAIYHTVLLLRVDEPELSSAQMAERLTVRLGKEVNAAWVRKTAQRAQEKYAELLVEEVRCSLEGAGMDEVREELRRLDLLRYCESALDRFD